jgi:hypothetical protein
MIKSFSIHEEYVSAAMVGINQTVIGLPFDSIKVWVQNNKRVWSRPLSNYYRGALPEFCAGVTANCLVFPIHSYTLPYTGNSFISGIIAGAIVSPVVYTFRFCKIYQQMNNKLSINSFITNKGRGYLTSLCRESLGMSMYFGTYHYMRKQELPIFISGAFAGLFNWGSSFPIDTITSRQIAQKISIQDAIRIGTLYRVYNICLLRSMIVNGCSFLVYESVRKLFEQ